LHPLLNLDLPDLDYSRDTKTHKTAETGGLSGKDIRIDIEADTSNGAVYIHTGE
jgi:hypothetical protein